MNIPINLIYEFHKIRTTAHIASVNYFAGLLGYHFPEHDNDKNIEPMRTGYAYKNYAKYHPGYKIPDNYDELFGLAHSTHHVHAPHHVEFYAGDVSRIPDVHLIEMICDWFSANFEQVNVLHDSEYKTALDWFNNSMIDKNWTENQLKIIRDTSGVLLRQMCLTDLMQIWEPVLDLSEL